MVTLRILAVALLLAGPARGQVTAVPAGPAEPKWTVETVYIFLSQRLEDLSARLTERAEASRVLQEQRAAMNKAALDSALQANDKRLEGMNEFRATLTAQATTFLSKSEGAARFDALGERIAALTSRLDKAEAQGAGSAATWAVIAAVVGVLLGIGGLAVALSKQRSP